MKKFEYNGYIRSSYPIISKWLNRSFKNIIEKSKVEFILKENRKELYIYDDFNGGFLFSAEFLGTFDEAQKFINTIVDNLKKNGISYYQFQWNEIDNEGIQIGEEYEINS